MFLLSFKATKHAEEPTERIRGRERVACERTSFHNAGTPLDNEEAITGYFIGNYKLKGKRLTVKWILCGEYLFVQLVGQHADRRRSHF